MIPPKEIKINNVSTINIELKLNKANNEYNAGKNDNRVDKGMEKLNNKEKNLCIQNQFILNFILWELI